MKFVGDHLATFVVEMQGAGVVEGFQPALELDKLNVAVVMEDLDPYLKMEKVPVRMAKERNVLWGIGIAMYTLSGERHPNHSLSHGNLLLQVYFTPLYYTEHTG